jgi:hypothetical protein
LSKNFFLEPEPSEKSDFSKKSDFFLEPEPSEKSDFSNKSDFFIEPSLVRNPICPKISFLSLSLVRNPIFPKKSDLFLEPKPSYKSDFQKNFFLEPKPSEKSYFSNRISLTGIFERRPHNIKLMRQCCFVGCLLQAQVSHLSGTDFIQKKQTR